MRNYSIAGKRGQWPAPEDTSLSYLILSYLSQHIVATQKTVNVVVSVSCTDKSAHCQYSQ